MNQNRKKKETRKNSRDKKITVSDHSLFLVLGGALLLSVIIIGVLIYTSPA
ncbi:MAG: hypothetical protein LUQ66_11195 [Methanoregula sp.]|nr:hypothetical protein [Methanoregula sp.]